MKTQGFDWYKNTKKFYSTLPLPNGLNTSINSFEAVLFFPESELQKLDSVEFSDLCMHEYMF
jgi:hypothetical protein